MISKLFRDPGRLQKHLNLPMLAERNTFLENLKSKGYSEDFLRKAANYLMWAVLAVPTLPSMSSQPEKIGQDEIAALMRSYFEINSIRIYQERRAVLMTIKFVKFLGLYDQDGLSGTPVLDSLFTGLNSRKTMASAPMLKEREKFLAYCLKKGYSSSRLKCMAYMQLFAIEVLDLQHVSIVTESELREAAVEHEKKQDLKRELKTHHSKKSFFYCMSKWLVFMNRYKPENVLYDFQEQIDIYLSHLKEDRNLSSHTIAGRRKRLRVLSRLISKEVSSLDNLKIVHVDNLVKAMHESDKVSRRTIASYIGELRGFLAYAATKGWCDQSLCMALKAPRRYTDEDIPYAPTKSQVKSAVEFYADSDLPSHIRNHTIMLMLSVYGMRTHELVNLSLDDIDWENETIMIRRAKGERPQKFPLATSVGNAITKYLMKVRNNSTDSRILFQCMQAPFRDITHATIYPIVSSALKQESPNIKHIGPHSLRHWTATHLVNEGFPLYNVSRQLGHECLDSTKVYAKVNLTQLRKVADMDWEEIL